MEGTRPSGVRAWRLGTGLAALVAVALGAWGYLQSQQVGQLTQQNGQLTQRVVQLSSALSSQQAVAAQLQQQVSDRSVALKEEAKRDLPISVSYHPALLGPGLVAVFRNNSTEPLEMAAVFSSSATGQQREAHLVVQAGGVQAFGHGEGWAFSSGQHITLSNSQFRALELVVP